MLGFKEYERFGDGAWTAPWKIRLSRAVKTAAIGHLARLRDCLLASLPRRIERHSRVRPKFHLAHRPLILMNGTGPIGVRLASEVSSREANREVRRVCFRLQRASAR